MIELYTWETPNGRKVSIMLEECGLPYKVHKVDIGKGEQFAPEFVALNPNRKIPAIVDSDGPEDGKPITLMESGAILVYLAGKTGRFLPESARGRYKALEWLMFQMGGVGPMFGQLHVFLKLAEPAHYALERYTREKDRLYGVLDRRLGEVEYLAGDYSIADIATYPWVARHNFHKVDFAAFPNVKRWFDALSARPAVIRGMAVPV